MNEPVWLQREVVVALQERLIAEFGGASGVRDSSLLESALARARNKFAYESPGHRELAASYAAGLVNNHPFVDGNKRIGFVAAVVFLEINGYRFTAPEADAVIQTLALAAGAAGEADYATWFKDSSARA